MKLTYAGVALHDLGAIFISDQSSAGEPEEAPQRFKHTLRVKFKTRQPAYSDNADLIRRIRGAVLANQEATLKVEEDNGTVQIEQTARVASHNLPENPNEVGTYLQSLEITFVYYEHIAKDKTNTLAATYTRDGIGAPTITLDTVESFKFSHDVKRLHELRPHRANATGRVEMRGKILGNPKASVTARRAVLYTAFDELRTQIKNGSQGTLVFGSFSQMVRVDSFTPELEQFGVTPHIAYNLSASFSEFPNESGYAQCEFTVSTREDKKEGKTFLTLSGKIEAQSEAAALSKLSTVRAAATAGYTALRTDKRSEQFSGEDGDTFFRLSFDEEYEKTTSNLTEWQLRVSDTEETRSGRFRRQYSGHVEAKGATFDSAYQTAHNKAKALGDNKHQFKVSGQVTLDDKQLSADRQMTGDLIVRVEFSYEYELTGTRVYAEIASEFNRQNFGLDSETVSGFIASADVSTCRTLYDTIKAGYGDYVIRNERIREDRQKIGTAAGVTKGQTLTPGNAGAAWGAAINTQEKEDVGGSPEPASSGVINPPLLTGYMRQFVRFEFAFEIHRPKATNSVSMSYRLSVFQDFVAREKHTAVSGTVMASSESEAETYLNTFIDQHGFGSRLSTRREHEYIKKPSVQANYDQALKDRAAATSKASTYQGMAFEESFRTKLTGSGAILQCSLEEDIECSGSRVVVKPTAESTDVFQACGTQSGRRTVSGECVATDEATALDWVRDQEELALYTGTGGFTSSGATADPPPRISIVPQWDPLVTGVARGGSANATLVRARFQFTRFYENLTLT